MSDLSTAIERSDFLLAEAAVNERLRRMPGIELHSRLEHSPLVYEHAGRKAMRRIYREYLELATEAKIPILLQTPTWRANQERVDASEVPATINQDSTRFMRGLIGSVDTDATDVWLAGLLGCKNDCYRPQEGLSAMEAERFHRWQIDQLATAGVDCLFAATLPSVQEALGIARAMQTTDLPYFLSFVIDKQGAVLDGTPLAEAIDMIDHDTRPPPTGFFVNCSYPTFLRAAEQPPALFQRLVGIQANASSLSHCELDGCAELKSESVATWGGEMLELNRRYGVKILGGCCGTDNRHLAYLTEQQRNR